jgi:hypothetical protein
MRSAWKPALLLACLYAGYFAFLAWSVPSLPPRLATHFDAAGAANGWMRRADYVRSIAAAAFFVPLLPVVLFGLLRFLPARFINLPHRDYWLAPERHAETAAFFLRQGLWLACLQVALFAGIHYGTIAANLLRPPRLSPGYATALFVSDLLFIGIWLCWLIIRFASRPQKNS